ncbi:MAG TPA: AMP-binding protein [Acidimicrobiales bacterium]|nr:AMP-binding protein [Acidimicrobiales bacterium]
MISRVFEACDPTHEALVTRSRRLSYAELDALCAKATGALAGMGITAGDRVAACLPNEVEVVAAFHATMRLGAIWVGVNKALAPPEKQFILDDSGASVFLDDPVALAEAIAAADPRQATDVDPFAPAGIAYTSGTTGFPKGAVHSQYNLLMPGRMLVESRGYDASLRKGDCFALTILNLQVLTTLLVAQCGGTSIVMDRMDAQGIAEWIRTERVTTWNGPPALLHSLAHDDAVKASDLASLDEVWTGGADCPEAIRAAFEEKFGLPVLATYGLTEAPTVVAIDPRHGPHVAHASGKPLAHLNVRIADAGDDGTGEICISPADDRYRLMLGYWNRDDATAETLRDGELHTGDVGFVDAGGFLHVRDRKSLVIIRGGANVYPAEVERVLQEVDGVLASAVVGVPDERLGERVVALIEGTASEEALRSHCEANLARYKNPERYVFVDAFPRNAMNKIIRKELPVLL